ncbi:hypothetical protein JAAARDRAFT_60705 [Jaapia argillacea MUCL 33604]|uniref:F-box domain-containing protein n=1 Tax=Jaapia argillacea MUCL 33604 TaxID=933084 RepID=A0A067PVE4_9AGAM|nr:hypothetical protein JAAARDRAFT_60705 [Jaapia argillacea MUCL 33604]
MSSRPLRPPGFRSDVVMKLPAELWHNIYNQLTRSDYHNLSLTCSSFRSSIRPFLFHKLQFMISAKPRSIHPPTGQRYCLLTDLDTSLRRLNHYALAPESVRECTFMVKQATREWPMGAYAHEGGERLIDEFFNVLPRFSSCTRLALSGLVLDAEKLDRIGRVEALSDLELEKCLVLCGPYECRPIPLTNFCIDGDGSYLVPKGDHITVYDNYFSIVDPLTVRSIKIMVVGPRILHCLLYSPSYVYDLDATFCSLVKLSLPHRATASLYFVPFLERCPNLREITFHPLEFYDKADPDALAEPLPPSLLLNLQKFVGPAFTFTPFTTFAVSYINLTGTCLPSTFQALLRQLHHPSRVREFRMSVIPLTPTLFRLLWGRLKRLESLELWMGQRAPPNKRDEKPITWEALLKELPEVAAPTLRRLTLHMAFMNARMFGDAWMDAWGEALRKKCEKLESVDFTFEDNMYSWSWPRKK